MPLESIDDLKARIESGEIPSHEVRSHIDSLYDRLLEGAVYRETPEAIEAAAKLVGQYGGGGAGARMLRSFLGPYRDDSRHVTREQTLRYVNEEADEDERSGISAHLEDCRRCFDIAVQANVYEHFHGMWNGFTAEEHGRLLRRHAELSGAQEDVQAEEPERVQAEDYGLTRYTELLGAREVVPVECEDAVNLLDPLAQLLASSDVKKRAEGEYFFGLVLIRIEQEPDLFSGFERAFGFCIDRLPEDRREAVTNIYCKKVGEKMAVSVD
jgi:hypothetical protein